MNVRIFSSSSLQYCFPNAMLITHTTHKRPNTNKFLTENMLLPMRFSRKIKKVPITYILWEIKGTRSHQKNHSVQTEDRHGNLKAPHK